MSLFHIQCNITENPSLHVSYSKLICMYQMANWFVFAELYSSLAVIIISTLQKRPFSFSTLKPCWALWNIGTKFMADQLSNKASLSMKEPQACAHSRHCLWKVCVTDFCVWIFTASIWCVYWDPWQCDGYKDNGLHHRQEEETQTASCLFSFKKWLRSSGSNPGVPMGNL